MLPGIQQPYRACARRALSLCFAALFCVASVHHSAGQAMRRLPTSMMPGPDNIGLTGNLRRVPGTIPAVANANHPLFETSYTGDASQVLATSRYGSVTGRDLYLWMLMTDSPNKAYLPELLKQARFPDEKEKLRKALKAEVDGFVFYNYVIPKLLPTAPPDPVYDFKHYVYTLPAWQTVYLQRVVGPSVTLLEADRQKYLQEHTAELAAPQRLRARYIFMRSAESEEPASRARVEVTMDELRASILRGEISFADAARKHSQAPSAPRGGEIPPFGHGELFFLFEHNAAALEPGGVSPIFRGPNGFYMVQLIEVLEPEEASLANPRHAKKVEEGLSRQVLKAAYEVQMRDMLLERRPLTEKPAVWDSLEDDEVVGSVCDFTICKGQMRSAWPGLEGNDLKLKAGELATLLRITLEREAMAQEVRSMGHGNDPMIERARWMAGNIIRRDAWLDQLRATLPISEEIVRKFWAGNPDLFTPLALKRVIKLTMLPSNTAPLPAQTRMELEKVLAQATGQPMTVTVSPHVPQEEEKTGLVRDTVQRTAEAFQMLTNPSEEPSYYRETYTPQSLQSIIDSAGDALLPSVDGEPAPGMDVIPAPSEVTTSTLDSLVEPGDEAVRSPEKREKGPATSVDQADDAASTATVLDISTTTAPRGGAAPTPAVGGVGPAGILPEAERGAPVSAFDASMVAPSTQPTPKPASTPERASQAVRVEEDRAEQVEGSIRGTARPPRTANTPRGGSVPVGVTAPGARVRSTPNPDNQLKAPVTSSIPYNPDWFYGRMDATEIQKVVGQYASSDWLLKMDDLGFVYVPDLADAPARLEKVPVGAFSRPLVREQSAVSWYIEEARTLPKPSFEEIKTQAYDVYRNVQLDKVTAEKYNSELGKAGIQYKF